MQKIALYNSAGGHNEVMGYLMESFRNQSITIFNNRDTFKYVEYFESLFGKVCALKPTSLFEKCCDEFDKIFVITMTGDLPSCIVSVKHKTYGIIHALGRKSPYINKYIALYPAQMQTFKQATRDDTRQFSYTFPFYHAPSNANFQTKKYILHVGALWDNDDDFRMFKKSIKYELISFSRGEKDKSRIMESLSNYLQNSLFILGKKTWHCDHSFTGSLALAYSFKVPIILPKFKQVEYDIPCVTFNENYCELVDYINNVNVDEYNGLLASMEEVREREIENNKIALCGL